MVLEVQVSTQKKISYSDQSACIYETSPFTNNTISCIFTSELTLPNIIDNFKKRV